MVSPGSASAATVQPRSGHRSKLSRFKKLLSQRQKSKDGETSDSQSNDRNEPGIDHELHAPVLNKESTARVSANVPITATEETSGPSQDASSAGLLCPIHELWNQAYDELKEREENLIKDYEATLCGDLAPVVGLTVIFSGAKVERKDQMATLLVRQIEEVKKNTWKLKFGGQDIPLKDLAQPVVSIVQWADDYVSGALSANPYASLAWGGVSLLLPLVLNPSKQAASLATGLDYISDLIVRSIMREKLYERRYESKASEEDRKKFISSHMMYRETLKTLYIQILKFQASSICYLSKKGAFRLGLDMIKWDDWKSLLNDVQKSEDAFGKVFVNWKDIRDQEDCEALFARHQEMMGAMISMSGDLSGLHVDVSSLRHAIEEAQRDTRRSHLLNWLSTIDVSERYNLGLDKLRADTGEWLLNGNQYFKKWQTSPNSFAWLNGKAGSGKSVLSSSIIKRLTEDNNSSPETAIAFFYFSFTDAKTQSVIEMLSSLIKQICLHRPVTPQSVESLVGYKEKGHRPDRKTLEETLANTICGFSNVYIVLDALDECPSDNSEREKLLESLSRIRNKGFPSLHLLCTSRRVADIEAVLAPVASSNPNVEIDLSAYMQAVDQDIGLYIDSTFETEPFKSWPGAIQNEARVALVEKANGMFQYVACQFDDLRRHRAPAKIREALRDLPKGLDATYDRILQGIDPDYRKQVASILKWLAFSLRPLRVEELAEIFILDDEKPMPFNEEDRLFTPEAVLNYLPALVVKVPVVSSHPRREFDDDCTEIRFAHFSIKEYLSSTRIAQTYFSTPEQTSHLHISNSCLAYHLQLSESILADDDALRRYALWDYVARYFADHLEKVDLASWTASVTSRATRAFAAHSHEFLNMVRIYDSSTMERSLQITIDELATPLFYAAERGLLQMTSLLIHNGASVNEPSHNDWSETPEMPLNTAAGRGHIATVQLLLENGADINKQGGFYGTPLQRQPVSENRELYSFFLKIMLTLMREEVSTEIHCRGLSQEMNWILPSYFLRGVRLLIRQAKNGRRCSRKSKSLNILATGGLTGSASSKIIQMGILNRGDESYERDESHEGDEGGNYIQLRVS